MPGVVNFTVWPSSRPAHPTSIFPQLGRAIAWLGGAKEPLAVQEHHLLLLSTNASYYREATHPVFQ